MCLQPVMSRVCGAGLSAALFTVALSERLCWCFHFLDDVDCVYVLPREGSSSTVMLMSIEEDFHIAT